MLTAKVTKLLVSDKIEDATFIAVSDTYNSPAQA
jgi:hypothetical protein